MSDRTRETLGYIVGLSLAALLTGLAFGTAYQQQIFGARTFAVVCLLGLMQAIIQFRFFLHVRLKGSARDDLLLLLFSTLIILLMVGGTLVLLTNLRERMM